MRILVVHGSNDLYGASRVLLTEVSLLTAKGDVTVMLPDDGPLTPALTKLGATVCIDSRLPIIRRREILHAIKAVFNHNRFTGYDLVVLWTLATSAYVPTLLSLRIPFYVAVHELLPERAGSVLRSVLLLGSFPVTACSDAVKDWLVSGGVTADRVHVTRPVLTGEQLERAASSNHHIYAASAPTRPRTIAVVGRTNGHKGHYQVLEAMQTSVLQHQDIRLLLAGAPFPGQEVEHRKIEDLASSDSRVAILGEISSVDELRGHVDLVVCLPTRPEPFGLVPIEAWCNGIRTVGYGAGGAAEAIDSVKGFIIDSKMGASGLSQMIGSLLERQDTWEAMPTPAAVGLVYSNRARRDVLDTVWKKCAR